jgi:hypothetical protein
VKAKGELEEEGEAEFKGHVEDDEAVGRTDKIHKLRLFTRIAAGATSRRRRLTPCYTERIEPKRVDLGCVHLHK